MYGPGGAQRFQKGQNAGPQRPPLLEIPPNLRMMFEPRVAVEFKPPIEKAPMPSYSGIAQYTSLFETAPPPVRAEFVSPLERRAQTRARLQKTHEEKNDLLASDWDPHNNPKATENAYTTLFVGRLSYETNEKKLRREFEQFGAIKTLHLVHDLEGKSRGYAFIEFENEADMTNAFRKADGKKIDGRRIVCDVERGRTVRQWKPTRLGGGLGGRPAAKSKKDIKEEAASQAAAAAAAASAMGATTGQPSVRVPTEVSRGDSRSHRRERSRSRDRERQPRSSFRRDHSRERDYGNGGGGGRHGGSYAPPPSTYGPAHDNSYGGGGYGGSATQHAAGRSDSRDRDRDRNRFRGDRDREGRRRERSWDRDRR